MLLRCKPVTPCIQQTLVALASLRTVVAFRSKTLWDGRTFPKG